MFIATDLQRSVLEFVKELLTSGGSHQHTSSENLHACNMFPILLGLLEFPSAVFPSFESRNLIHLFRFIPLCAMFTDATINGILNAL